tara:strand:+ start:1225 stop:1398 length:174 start_codon:yes stop_codon:yes gene_type:complete
MSSHPGVTFKFLLNRIDLVAFNALNDLYEDRESFKYDTERKKRINQDLKTKLGCLNE